MSVSQIISSNLLICSLSRPHQFRSDGTRRRPPPSATHGWLAKIRGTLTGNEELRSKVRLSSFVLCSCGINITLDIQGMREMKDARARRRYAAKVKRQRSVNSGRTLFSFLGISNGKKSQPPNVISKRRTTSPKPSIHQTSPRVRSPARSPPGKPSPRHRASESSNRMPGHYDLSHPRRNNRRSTT
jgi:hypothetical protein